MEDMEKNILAKIEKLEQEVKALRVSLNYAQAQITSSSGEWPQGKYCILASGRCPDGFKRHEGHLKSLYLYSSHTQFVNSAKFGSSSMAALAATVENTAISLVPSL
ncbi:hypothetical protein OS493_030073 [Desmophyllum pertusum]|uniref:Uncharacterized protein n=1 Tax=Desmophyllum pertusum TaxID=174260 RepID=A0A9X0CV73_9CNID|nr:hypothetical protein OS493_030073 [Desmophyllum pertusum]